MHVAMHVFGSMSNQLSIAVQSGKWISLLLASISLSSARDEQTTGVAVRRRAIVWVGEPDAHYEDHQLAANE